VLHTTETTANTALHYCLYFWQGSDSLINDKGASALLTLDLKKQMKGVPDQRPVVQGKESMRFRSIFKGKMIIHQGKAPSVSSLKGEGEVEPFVSDTSLYCVRGATPMTTVATQLVSWSASSLNAYDCFVLVAPSDAFIFRGEHATAQSFNTSKQLFAILAKGRVVEEIYQGTEPEAFWSAFGGKVDIIDAQSPRCFICSTMTGAFRVEETENFDQSDLSNTSILILDSYYQLYIWTGSSADEEELSQALQFANEYITASVETSGRLSTTVTTVESGVETFMFTRFFLNWDAKYFEKSMFVDPMELKKVKIAAEKEFEVPCSSVLKLRKASAA
jgi:Gelsolin repeat